MHPFTTRFSFGCIFLFLLSFALRCSAIWFSADAFREDPDAYRALALSWKSTGTFGLPHDGSSRPTAFRPPLYPAVLTFLVQNETNESPAIPVSRIGFLHAILGALTAVGASICFYLWPHPNSNLKSTARGGKHLVISLIPGFLVACDPILIRQSQLIMTETLATFLMTLTMLGILWRTTQPNRFHTRAGVAFDFALGLLLGLQCLCRPTALAWLLLWLAGAFILTLSRFRLARNGTGSDSSPSWGRSSALYLVGTLLVLLPWGVRNWHEIGSFRLTTTHGGYTLLLANNDSLYDHFETSWSRAWDEADFFEGWARQKAIAKNELAEDQLAQSIAWRTIQTRPWDFAKSCVIRIGWLWAPWPNQSSLPVQTAIGLWYGTLYLLASIGCYQAWGHRKSSLSSQQAIWLLLSVLLSVTCVHAVYWSNMRMRSVCIPSLAIFASLPLLFTLPKENTTPIRKE